MFRDNYSMSLRFLVQIFWLKILKKMEEREREIEIGGDSSCLTFLTNAPWLRSYQSAHPRAIILCWGPILCCEIASHSIRLGRTINHQLKRTRPMHQIWSYEKDLCIKYGIIPEMKDGRKNQFMMQQHFFFFFSEVCSDISKHFSSFRSY